MEEEDFMVEGETESEGEELYSEEPDAFEAEGEAMDEAVGEESEESEALGVESPGKVLSEQDKRFLEYEDRIKQQEVLIERLQRQTMGEAPEFEPLQFNDERLSETARDYFQSDPEAANAIKEYTKAQMEAYYNHLNRKHEFMEMQGQVISQSVNSAVDRFSAKNNIDKKVFFSPEMVEFYNENQDKLTSWRNELGITEQYIANVWDLYDSQQRDSKRKRISSKKKKLSANQTQHQQSRPTGSKKPGSKKTLDFSEKIQEMQRLKGIRHI